MNENSSVLERKVHKTFQNFTLEQVVLYILRGRSMSCKSDPEPLIFRLYVTAISLLKPQFLSLSVIGLNQIFLQLSSTQQKVVKQSPRLGIVFMWS